MLLCLRRALVVAPVAGGQPARDLVCDEHAVAAGGRWVWWLFMACMARRGRGRDAGRVASRPLAVRRRPRRAARSRRSAVARGGEELDAADHLVVVAGLAVLLPLVVLEAAVDGDQPAGGEDLGGGFAGLAEGRDVDVAGLAAAGHVIDGEAELAHRAAVGELAELGFAGQSSCEGDYLELRVGCSDGSSVVIA